MEALIRQDEAVRNRIRQAEEFLDPRKNTLGSINLAMFALTNACIPSQMTNMCAATGQILS